jgi:hypothetical protein
MYSVNCLRRDSCFSVGSAPCLPAALRLFSVHPACSSTVLQPSCDVARRAAPHAADYPTTSRASTAATAGQAGRLVRCMMTAASSESGCLLHVLLDVSWPSLRACCIAAGTPHPLLLWVCCVLLQAQPVRCGGHQLRLLRLEHHGLPRCSAGESRNPACYYICSIDRNQASYLWVGPIVSSTVKWTDEVRRGEGVQSRCDDSMHHQAVIVSLPGCAYVGHCY